MAGYMPSAGIVANDTFIQPTEPTYQPWWGELHISVLVVCCFFLIICFIGGGFGNVVCIYYTLKRARHQIKFSLSINLYVVCSITCLTVVPGKVFCLLYGHLYVEDTGVYSAASKVIPALSVTGSVLTSVALCTVAVMASLDHWWANCEVEQAERPTLTKKTSILVVAITWAGGLVLGSLSAIVPWAADGNVSIFMNVKQNHSWQIVNTINAVFGVLVVIFVAVCYYTLSTAYSHRHHRKTLISVTYTKYSTQESRLPQSNTGGPFKRTRIRRMGTIDSSQSSTTSKSSRPIPTQDSRCATEHFSPPQVNTDSDNHTEDESSIRIHRVSVCDSNIANCSSCDVSACNYEGYRFGLDLCGTPLVLPGTVMDDVKVQQNSRLVENPQNVEKVMINDGLAMAPDMYIDHWKNPEIGQPPYKGGGEKRASHRDSQCTENRISAQHQIYTIDENNEAVVSPRTKEHAMQPGQITCTLDSCQWLGTEVTSADNLSAPMDAGHLSDGLSVPTRSVSSTFANSSIRSSSLDTSNNDFLSPRPSNTSSSSRSFFKLPQKFPLRSCSSDSEHSLPPLIHGRRAPGSSWRNSASSTSVAMVDAATATDDINENGMCIAEKQPLDAGALMNTDSKIQETVNSKREHGGYIEAWGTLSGTASQNLQQGHPFFQENMCSPNCMDKINDWRVSTSSAFTFSDLDQGMDEPSFYNLCFSNHSTSTEECRSVSQIGPMSCGRRNNFKKSVDTERQRGSVPVKIRVIRPSGSNYTSSTVMGERVLKRRPNIFAISPESNLEDSEELDCEDIPSSMRRQSWTRSEKRHKVSEGDRLSRINTRTHCSWVTEESTVQKQNCDSIISIEEDFSHRRVTRAGFVSSRAGVKLSTVPWIPVVTGSRFPVCWMAFQLVLLIIFILPTLIHACRQTWDSVSLQGLILFNCASYLWFAVFPFSCVMRDYAIHVEQ